MIKIEVIGIDPYLLRQISKDITNKLSSIYEISEDEIDFYANDGLLVHNGVEQNSWNLIIKVLAPLKIKVLEGEAVKVLKYFFEKVCVNFEVIFEYYSFDNRHVFLNDSHPRFITEQNTVIEDDDCDCDDCHNHENEEEPYLGDIFEEINK